MRVYESCHTHSVTNTHSCVWHDLVICVIWMLFWIREEAHVQESRHTHSVTHTHACVWHDLFICVTCLEALHDSFNSFIPPKNGKIALLLPTNCKMCSKQFTPTHRASKWQCKEKERRQQVPTHKHHRHTHTHSCWPRTVWCVVNMLHTNGMSPLIIANGTKWYAIFGCNSPWLYLRLKNRSTQ